METDFFVTLVGVSLSLAGLASLISLFHHGKEFTAEEIFIFRSIILVCLVILIASLLPIALGTFVKIQPTIWQICSIFYVIVGGGALTQLLHQLYTGKTQFMYKVSILFVFGTFGMLAWAVFNAAWLYNPTMYVVGLLWAVVVVCFRLYLFLTSVTEPILHKNDSAIVEQHSSVQAHEVTNKVATSTI